MQVLVLVMILNAAIEVYRVDDPTITSFERFISLSERNDLGTLRFNEYGYVMAFRIEVETKGKTVFEIPQEIG